MSSKKRNSSADVSTWLSQELSLVHSTCPIPSDVSESSLAGLVTAKESELCGIAKTCSAEVSESSIPADMEWEDPHDHSKLRLLDGFLLLNQQGEAVGLEALDKIAPGDKVWLFGNVVEPAPLKEGEQPRFWEREELANLKRSARLSGVECSEWCIDLTYGDESIWVITSGAWYKVRGENGPGSALEPSPLYKQAFTEARKRFEACLHLARLLQAPGKKLTVTKGLEEAVALSNFGEWPIDQSFILSRAEFIAEQIESVQNFGSTSKGASTVGQTFANDLLKKRNSLVSKMIAETAKPVKVTKKPKLSVHVKPPSAPKVIEPADNEREVEGGQLEDEDDDEELDESEDDQDEEDSEDERRIARAKRRRRSKSNSKRRSSGKVSPAVSTSWLFPMEDLTLLQKLHDTGGQVNKLPPILKKVKLYEPGRQVTDPLPLPPTPSPVLPNATQLRLSNDMLGSLLASFEAIQVLSDYLRLTPFGLDQFLECVLFYPEPVNHVDWRTRENRLETPPVLSPLFTEILLRLVDMILEQPEHRAVANSILGQEELEQTLKVTSSVGTMPFLNKLNLQFIVLNLITSVERIALPKEMKMVDRLTNISYTASTPKSSSEANPKDVLAQTSQETLEADESQGGGERPKTSKKIQEELDALDKLYPQTTEGYALIKCRNIIHKLMQHPLAEPFSVKVDPDALGIPDYFNVIDKPMDFGTICDRLYSGYYCPESALLLARKADLETRNLNKWIEILRLPSWKQTWFFEGKILLQKARQNLADYKANTRTATRSTVNQFEEACDKLAWVLEQRKQEIIAFDMFRRQRMAMFQSILSRLQQQIATFGVETPAQAYEELVELLAVQGMRLLEPVPVLFPPLGLNIGDLHTTTTLYRNVDSMIMEKVPHQFRVSVTKLYAEQASKHRKLWDTVKPGDRIIFVGSTPTVGLDNQSVANTFKACPFPVLLVFARVDPSALCMPQVELRVPDKAKLRATTKKRAESTPNVPPASEQQASIPQTAPSVLESLERLVQEARGNDPAPTSLATLPILMPVQQNPSPPTAGEILLPSINNQQIQQPPLESMAESVKKESLVYMLDSAAPAPERQQQHSQQKQGDDMATSMEKEETTGRAEDQKEEEEEEEEEDDDDEEEEEAEGMGGGLESFFADVQQVFTNCLTFNAKRAQISGWAVKLRELFEQLYQHHVLDLMERIDSTRQRQKYESAHRRSPQDVNLFDVVRSLNDQDLSSAPVGIRTWVLEWLIECLLQTEDVRTLIESGAAPSALAARIYRPRGGKQIAAFSSDGQSTPNANDAKFLNIQKSPLLRLEPIGKDRFDNQYWWFDGDAQGRLFVQRSPSLTRPIQQDQGDQMGGIEPVMSLSEQAELVKGKADAFIPAFADQKSLEWGVLKTARQLEQLIEALNPLGKNDFFLLQSLFSRYQRIASRMALAGRGEEVPRGDARLTFIQDVVESQTFKSTLLESKVKYGMQVAVQCRPRKNQRSVQEPEQEQPLPSPLAVFPLLTPHLQYDNRVGGLWSKKYRGELLNNFDDSTDYPFTHLIRILGMDNLLSSDASSLGDFLTCALLNMEALLWESRNPMAMGRTWEWPRNRDRWRKSLEELKAVRSNQMTGTSPPPAAAVGGRGADSVAYEVEFLAARMLDFEANCVSFWCAAGTTSLASTCVRMLWRLSRLDWCAKVEKSRTISELGVLLYMLVVNGIDWRDSDRCFAPLLMQHPSKISTRVSLEILDEGLFRGGAEMVGMSSLSDVTFGQVVSTPTCASHFGFVAFGAYLSTHLYSALFDRTDHFSIGFPSHFGKAVNMVGSLALLTAASSAQNGALGLKGSTRPSTQFSGSLGRLSGSNTIAIESMGTVKKAVLQVMGALGMRQRDVSEQIGCSQSHLSLWLNAKDDVAKRKFEGRIINWVRMKNYVHGWVQPHDVLDSYGHPIDIHRGIAPIPGLPSGAAQGEAPIPALTERTRDALLPLIREVCALMQASGEISSSPRGMGGAHMPRSFPDTLKVLPDQRHPYQFLFRSSGTLSWKEVIPFSIATCTPRIDLEETSYSAWREIFTPSVRGRLESAGIGSLEPGSTVLYFPEGHAFANAHSELRLGAEMLRGGRDGVFGPSVADVFPSRCPVVCRVTSVSFHGVATGDLDGSKMTATPYCSMVLEPLHVTNPLHQRVSMLDLGLIAQEELHGGGRRTVQHMLYQVLVHLTLMEDAHLCMNIVTPAVYTDLTSVLGPAEEIVDLRKVTERIGDGAYNSFDDFLNDLEKMARDMRKYYVEAHQYSIRAAQAAARVLLRAKLLVRHPETLCELKEQETAAFGLYPSGALRVVLRPQFESEFPMYVANLNMALDSLVLRDMSANRVAWSLGQRVRRWPSNSEGQTENGKIVGFRYPLVDLQLPWASVVVEWDNPVEESELDTTLDLPKFARQHVNPWELRAL